jgi:hypothetical protein
MALKPALTTWAIELFQSLRAGPDHSCSTVSVFMPDASLVGSPGTTPRQGQNPDGLPQERLPVGTPRPGRQRCAKGGVSQQCVPGQVRKTPLRRSTVVRQYVRRKSC